MPPARRKPLNVIVREIIEENDWSISEAGAFFCTTQVRHWLNGKSKSVGSEVSARYFAHYYKDDVSHIFNGISSGGRPLAAYQDELEEIRKDATRRLPGDPRNRPNRQRVGRRPASFPSAAQDPALREIAAKSTDVEETAELFVQHFVKIGTITDKQANKLRLYALVNETLLSTVLFEAAEVGLDAYTETISVTRSSEPVLSR